jgi:hypothetical protein
MWQAVWIDWHYQNYKANRLTNQVKSASEANVYAASALFL